MVKAAFGRGLEGRQPWRLQRSQLWTTPGVKLFGVLSAHRAIVEGDCHHSAANERRDPDADHQARFSNVNKHAKEHSTHGHVALPLDSYHHPREERSSGFDGSWYTTSPQKIFCGFGCQMHHAAYCLIVAYAMERTLVFSDSTLNYADTRWDEVFQPLSNTCNDLDASDFPGARRDRLVVRLGAARGFLAHTPFHPPAVPADLLPTVRLFHGAPHAWWVGQVLSYLMRLQPRSDQLVRAALRRLNFTRPIVGIHVRRSDKLFHEAEYHAVDEYMAAVEDIYETLEITNGGGARKIYVATDDVSVFDEINKK
ncbi:alpha-(1,6)-fucosyltransferase-like [Schistocerca gregaria]|uniref:alpha-(1,6)-fucosyltransferase-like n=1 Tax=Schistocerca gregaria TaxID=7010 RepID=UPI00211DD859|nr:alpha-(1,6)-fucosyltransferase-like [Schistocerca gregaria]